MNGKVTKILFSGLSLLALAGCEVGVEGHRGGVFVASSPPPPPQPEVVYTPAPAYPPDAVVVQEPPPPDPYEQPVGVAPAPDYVWVGGAYFWEGGRYHWHPGHWDRPPYHGARFDRDHWEHGPHGYVFVHGGWH